MMALLAPLLSGAWWLARIGGIKTAAARFWNANALAALVAGLAVVSVVIGVAMFVIGIKRDARAIADGWWTTRLAAERTAASARQAERDRAGAAAAAAERQDVERQRDAAIERVAGLEAELARLKQESGDPVIYPRALARRLRK